MFYSMPKIVQCTCHEYVGFIICCKSINIVNRESIEPVEYGVTPVEKIPNIIVE